MFDCRPPTGCTSSIRRWLTRRRLSCISYSIIIPLQASDRLYYLYQTLADTEEALGSSPEGQAALQAAQQRLLQQQQPAASGSGSSSSSAKGAKKKGAAAEAGAGSGAEGEALLAEVVAALSDDLNTPLAVAALSAPLKLMNDLLHTKKVGLLPQQGEELGYFL